jgi:hypothetical protein
MNYSQKYALVYFISPIKNGVQFHMSEWPLHITIADVFAIDRHKTDIDAKLAILLTQIKTVETNVTNNTTLGTTPIILLDRKPSLVKLHTDIASLLEENGAVFNNPEFTRDGFLPHSTIQKNGRLRIGDNVTIDSVSLVDMFPDDNWEQRKVLATFKLKRL